MHHRFLRPAAVCALLAALFTAPIHAQTCPFDNGGSDAINDGVVLTRYALGITGAPLTASTRYASLDPLQVKRTLTASVVRSTSTVTVRWTPSTPPSSRDISRDFRGHR